jgi:hypothetical protein
MARAEKDILPIATMSDKPWGRRLQGRPWRPEEAVV